MALCIQLKYYKIMDFLGCTYCFVLTRKPILTEVILVLLHSRYLNNYTLNRPLKFGKTLAMTSIRDNCIVK